MKKIIMITVVLLSLFGGMSSLKADTLYRTSSENGKVKLSVNTEEGFVGALDLTVKVTGNVTVKAVTFASSLEKNYVKKYTYNKETGLLTFYIATGSKTKNLASSKGTIEIGTIAFSNKTSNKEEFNVTVSSMTTTNANYQSVNRSSLQNNNEDSFVYQVENTSGESPKEETPETTDNKTTDNKTDGEKNTKDQTTKNTEPTGDTTKEEESATDKQKVEEKKAQRVKEKAEKQKKQETQMGYLILGGVLFLGVIVSLIYVRKNNK